MKVLCPVKGFCKDITEANDPAFSQKMLGDGLCVQPQDTKVYSPVEGEITMVFPTKHALGIKTKEEVEVLLHLGVDTVELGGKYFASHVKAGDYVTQNSLLITYDYKKVEKEGYDTDIMIILTSGVTGKTLIKEKGIKNKGESILTIA